MRIAIIGAGPAGLYLAYLLKRRRPDADITVVEQNPANATFGFGVVFSDRALEFLRDDDPDTYAAITPQMETWDDMTLVHKNERVVIDGIGFAAIGRLKLLQLLQERVRSVGVDAGIRARGDARSTNSPTPISSSAPTASIRWCATRSPMSSAPASVMLTNRFAWFGTHQGFRHADADVSPHADRRFQRAPLSLCAGPQHIHRRS